MSKELLKIATIIKNSLRKLNLSGNTSKVILNNPTEVMWDFLTILYEKQKMIYILNLNNLDLYPENKIPNIKLSNPGFLQQAVYASGNDYFRLQEQIQKCYELLEPIKYLKSTEQFTGNNIIGFDSHHTRKAGIVRFQVQSTMDIYGANAAQLHHFATTPSITEFANKWNTVKVPYDKTLKVSTSCLYPITLNQGYYYFRKLEFKKD